MVLKKSLTVELNGDANQSINKDIKPVVKKSKKRKSAQIGAGGEEAGEDTRKSVVNAAPAKESKKEQQLEGAKDNDSPIKTPVSKKSKKRKSAQIGAGGGEAGDDSRKSVVNATPAKESKKEQQLEGAKDNDSPITAPVTKKSKKRKSAQNGAGGGEAGDDSRKSVVNATPPKKAKKGQQLEGSKGNDSPIVAKGKGKKPSLEDNELEKAIPEPKAKKEKKMPLSRSMLFENNSLWNERAFVYLKTWKENRVAWRFVGRMQSQMVRNMLDDRMADEIFPQFLEHMASGNAKTIEEVRQLASEAINSAPKDWEANPAVVRARLILETVKPKE